ncbi:MAG: ATP-binding cassette domain-containing protein [Sandaracinaceae bacterium]|jgi:phospholipid/cholesterol/gamma-HCH transport system ATP-binding protein|nr:ATP-binding cassette domain-containing protein [Sandaracinaceae bacterium]
MPIVFRNIHKTFGDKVVLAGVDLTINDGECFFIIGASGVGKSVLIKHLVGLLKADSGDIFLDDKEVSHLTEEEFYAVRMQCAMVFQNATLFDSMTCIENVALPLRKHKGMSHEASLVEAKRRLEQVHMEAHGLALPAALGDGMRKRVAIARALTMDPRFVLFDEPTTSLDPVSARRVDQMIRELCDELHVTSVVVSHDLTSIFTIADRIAMLYKGAVHMLGTPDEFRRTEDAVVQQFIQGQAEGPMEV